MKKIFTLIAVAAMAMTANAQGKYAMTEADEYGFGDQPKRADRVANCEMTFGDANDPGDGEPAAFAAAAADSHIEGYTAYTKGNGVNGDKPGGTAYVFKPAINGSITVAIVLNSGKKFYVLEDGTALSNYDGITTEEKYYGTYSFNVTAGKTYKVYCAGSKLGFYGFEFSDQPTSVKGIKNVAVNNGAIYNIAGQKVANDYKGLVIKNGRKMIQK